jgi:type II secretory pathway pseudopilin PulG
VLRAISGPLTLHIPAGTAELDLRLPFSDTTAAADLVEHCAEIPGFAEAGASFYDGACHVAIPALGYTLDIWIENNELRVGKKGGGKAGADVPMTAIGAEIADTPAVFAFWGRGTLFGQGPAQMPKLPAVPGELLMGLRALGVLSELGASSRIDGDKLRVTFVVRTIWSNPDDVVAKLAAISPQAFLDGKAADAAGAIAAGAPGAPFAADYKAGTGGMMAPAAVIGMLAAVAIPAFMDYMKKGKKSEAELQLNRIAKSAKAYYIENAAFPAGEAPLTPPTSCCEGSGGKCDPAGAGWMNEAWAKLDFMIDDPTRFQYRYRSDGKTLEAEAIGDLDCDGNTITYKLTMTADQGNPMARIEAPPPNTD